MKILGIETSCDETAAAVVEDGSNILSNVVSSQVDIHARYGGIVPEVASRQHLITILPTVKQAVSLARAEFTDLDAIAVTYGPGLAGSLLVGVNFAKAVALSCNLPIIGINHLSAHIYANWLSHNQPSFPSLCLIASGGHSDLVLMSGHNRFKKIGRTRDDAAGEAFDKAARILELGYPGGPVIQSASEKGTPSVRLPRAWLKGSDDFSFSGLKTALLHLSQSPDYLTGYSLADVAASFQQAIVDVLTQKTIQAAIRLKVKQILLSGGVAANTALRDQFIKQSPVPVLIPPPSLCTDNAAMIASCGYYTFSESGTFNYDIDVVPSLSI